MDAADHVKPFVHEGGSFKALHFSIHEIQSRMALDDPAALDLGYTRLMMGFLLFQPAPAHIVMIGLGGGSLAKFCHRELPRTCMRVVEINPHVIALRDEFHVPPESERFSVIRGDGAAFVRAHPACCDVLLVDGFDSEGQPEALCSQAFYDDCAWALQDEGVLVVNLCADPCCPAWLDRLRRAFGDDAVWVVSDEEAGNHIVFACKAGPWTRRRPTPACALATLAPAAAQALSPAFASVAAALQAQSGLGPSPV